MATPLMTPWKVRYVVPWKSRCDFLRVFHDLYCDDKERKTKALERVATWKSRVGNKLSVAIESSAALIQSCEDHQDAIIDGSLRSKDWALRCSFSLALIRFVNHITEKGQTKATAQPVHLVAKEFGIPEWIVRLRHDATHSSLPCLETLATAAKWAIQYLKTQFWECQMQDEAMTKEEEGEEGGGENVSGEVKETLLAPSSRQIRTAISSFQKSRFEELKASSGNKDELEKTRVQDCKRLNKYLRLGRPRFLNCLLEDGALIASAEQLEAFCIKSEDLLCAQPPLVPVILAEFWKPIIHDVSCQGMLPLMLQSAIFSVTDAEGLRNYQLVAWVASVLSNLTSTGNHKPPPGTWQGKIPARDLFKKRAFVPKKTLLTACLQNLNPLTAYLLKYLVSEEEIGSESYEKLRRLLNLHSEDEEQSFFEEEAESKSGNADSESTFTVEDLKKIKQTECKEDVEISTSTVDNIQASMGDSESIWKLCEDVVDWAKVPLGCLPVSRRDEDGDDGDYDCSLADKFDSDSETKLGHSSSDQDSENEHNGRKRSWNRPNDALSDERSPDTKQPKYVVKGDGLL